MSRLFMATRCAKCGAEIPEGWTTCRTCFEPVKREGFLTRLLRVFGNVNVNVNIGQTPSAVGSPRVNIKVIEHIKIRDSKTGEMREYHSLDEVPAEYREKIQQARQ